MADFDERALIERCRKGTDEAAFAELVDRYKDLVYGVVLRLVPDRSQADDIAQEVFLRVHRGLPYFRGEARLSTWIYRIVANAVLQDQGRGLKTTSLDDDEGARAAARPDRQFNDFEVRDRLEKGIARLPPHYRFLIAAHYL